MANNTPNTKQRNFSLFETPSIISSIASSSAAAISSSLSSMGSNSNANIQSTASIGSNGGAPMRRKSLAKADNLSVALSGGTSKSKIGQLKKKNSTIFGTNYKASFVKVDNGDLVIAMNEEALADADIDEKSGDFKKHSLFEIRELKVLTDPTEFQIKLGLPEAKTTIKTVILKADTAEEAVEWIETIKHEIKNQVLVCKTMANVLSEKGKPERAEPLFLQSIEALTVAYGPEHIEVSDTLRSYAQWLKSQNRLQEAIMIKKRAKFIAKKYIEDNKVDGLTVSDDSDTEDIVNGGSNITTAGASASSSSVSASSNGFSSPYPPRPSANSIIGTSATASAGASASASDTMADTTDSPRGRPKSWRFSFGRSSRTLSSPR